MACVGLASSDNVWLTYLRQGLPQDNLAVDADGGLWATGMPKSANRVREHFARPELPSPSTALWITLNTGRSAFFGEKYKVTKALEDDGTIVSGSTSAVYDSQRMRIFMSGRRRIILSEALLT